MRELAVDGKDVMRELAIPPSRRVGEMLEGTARKGGGGSIAERARDCSH